MDIMDTIRDQIENNSVVEVLLVDGRLVIKPIPVEEWTLEQLLAGVTSENLHGEIDTGDIVGDEIW